METMIAAISTAVMMTSGRYMKPNSSQKWSSMTRRNVRAGRLTGSPPVPAGFGVDAGVPGNSHTAALGRVGACTIGAVSYTHLRAHETRHDLVCRLLLEKKKKKKKKK